MTNNQIAFQNYKENARHNVVSEGETNRHNVVVEFESNRHNIVTEVETNRHNVVGEQVSWATVAVAQQNANTNVYNAQTNRINAGINQQNANTNAYNASTNFKNMIINSELKDVRKGELDVHRQTLNETYRHNYNTEVRDAWKVGTDAASNLFRTGASTGMSLAKLFA